MLIIMFSPALFRLFGQPRLKHQAYITGSARKPGYLHI